MRWTLKDYLTEHDLTPYRLAKVTGLSVNTIYPLVRGEAQRVSLETLQTVLNALDDLTGKRVELSDVLERDHKAVDLSDAGIADYVEALSAIDDDVPSEELAVWNKAFEQASR